MRILTDMRHIYNLILRGAERDIEHLKNAEATYSIAAHKYNYNIIHCVKDDKIRSIEDISDEVYNIVKEKLG